MDKYQIKANSDQRIFDFVSIGPKGKFHKRVVFAKTSYDGVYSINLADFDHNSGYLDYYSISDNGDRDRILATVVSCLFAFFNEYPNTYVYATGSTPARTRLYRMMMSKYFALLEDDFNVFGELENDWERFRKDGSYRAFMVSLKRQE